MSECLLLSPIVLWPRSHSLRVAIRTSTRSTVFAKRRQILSEQADLPSDQRRAIGSIASPTLKRPVRSAQIPIARAAPPCVPPARLPCMGLFLSRRFGRRRILCPSSVSLFDLKARFFVQTRASLGPARAGAVKVGRRTNLRHAPPLPGHTLTGSSTTARLVQSG